MKKLNKKGFTLVELIVVIAIIGILAAVLVPSVTSYIGKAQKSSATQNAANKYQEYVLAVVDECQQDIKDVTVGAGWYWTDGTYVCLIEDGVVTVTEKTDAGYDSDHKYFAYYKLKADSTGYEVAANKAEATCVEYTAWTKNADNSISGSKKVFYVIPEVPAAKDAPGCSAPKAKA